MATSGLLPRGHAQITRAGTEHSREHSSVCINIWNVYVVQCFVCALRD